MTAAWSPGQIRFDFSGGQPREACVLLTQALVLTPRVEYQLSFEYRGDGSPSTSAFDWYLDAPGGEEAIVGRALAPLASPLSTVALQNWVSAARVFPQVRGTLARLRFLYRRQPGTVRYQGSVWLRQLRWEVR